jgi:hypothetical protein
MKKNLNALLVTIFLLACAVVACSFLGETTLTPQTQDEDFINKPISNQLEITRNCISTTSNEFGIHAQLIFKDRNTQTYQGFALTSGRLYNLSDAQWTQYYISPTHDEYIYYQKDAGWFFVPKPTNPLEKYIFVEGLPDFDDRYLGFNWLYENHLLLENYYDEPLPELHLFNLRTKEYEKIFLDLPSPLFLENQYYGENKYGRYLFSIETNPQMTRALFYSSDKTKKIYWDMEEKKSLAEFPMNPEDYVPGSGFINSPPGQFSPDGEEYYVILSVDKERDLSGRQRAMEVFHIDRDGSVNQLTNFSNFYSSVEIRMEPIFKDNLYIPLWVDLKGKKYFAESKIEEEIPKLIFLNTRTGELRGICFVEDYRFGERPVVDSVVYGDYFLIPLYPPGESQHPVWHIVNLVRNEMYSLNFQYLNNLLYLGWLSYYQ